MNRGQTQAIVEINHAAGKFKSSIVLRVDNKYIDVKSMLSLSITLFKNEKYKLEIHGPDEIEAKSAMAEQFAKHGLIAEIN
ncbi:HPr family phosphocarrier protein [Paenibacillus hamazuiensis]|uniref:HPr family phosphocarrier protein n=1 Tax=Paenibacillus hamazuiensis TaxID=2936508 RepID=UPI00200DF781|nr:HPr family phosphocarrier protein [Paenibacillus hamazuiensis]